MTPIRGNKPVILGVDDIAGSDSGPEGSVQISAVVPGLVGWEVVLTVPLRGDDAYAVVDLRVRPAWDKSLRRRVVPAGGVQAATLRALPLTAIMREAFQPGPPGSIGWYMSESYPEASAEIVRSVKGGRPRVYDDAFYAEVAVDWERITSDGTGALGRFTIERKSSQSTAKNWIMKATEKGFLHRSQGRGPRARRATDKAWALLRNVNPTNESGNES